MPSILNSYEVTMLVYFTNMISPERGRISLIKCVVKYDGHNTYYLDIMESGSYAVCTCTTNKVSIFRLHENECTYINTDAHI
jgi:hypothetical protein